MADFEASPTVESASIGNGGSRPGEEMASEDLWAKEGGPVIAKGPSGSRVRFRDVGVSEAGGGDPAFYRHDKL